MTLSKAHYLSLTNGRFNLTSPSDLAQLFRDLPAADGHDNIVMYFHGGLVDQRNGMATAERLLDYYSDLDAYFVFFVWEAGLVEVLQHNLREIFGERIFQQLLTRVTQFAQGKLEQSNATRGTRLELPDDLDIEDELRSPANGVEPFAVIDPHALPATEQLRSVEEQQFRETLETDFIIEQEAKAIANGIRSEEEVANDASATRGGGTRASTHTLMSPAVLDDVRAESPDPAERGLITTARIVTGGVAVLTRVINRFARRRDHGMYATIVEELLREFYLANAGKLVWDLMKQDTADAFGGDPQIHGGTAFLQNLASYVEHGARPRITLVGHSTGALYICNLLRNADAILPPNVAFDVVFLAPAVSFKFFAETIRIHGRRVASLRMFGMLDEVERADRLVPLVYPHSLLYLVSGLLEDEPDTPLIGMKRYFTGVAPYGTPEVLAGYEYLIAELGRTVWSKTTATEAGLMSSAIKHGDFDNNLETLESLRHMLKGA